MLSIEKILFTMKDEGGNHSAVTLNEGGWNGENKYGDRNKKNQYDQT